MSMHANYPPQQIVVYTQTAWSRFWGWVLWLGLFVCILILIGQWVMLADYFDTTGGVEETRPLGSREGKVPGARMLGVTHSRTAGQVSDLHAVRSLTAVAALPEVGGDVSNFDAVRSLAAVAAFAKYQRVDHSSSSRDLSTSAMK